ncbi:hypothetical protein MTO96_019298 [Rhipicephalus appendiculatus]
MLLSTPRLKLLSDESETGRAAGSSLSPPTTLTAGCLSRRVSKELPWRLATCSRKSRAWFSEGTNEFDSFDFNAVPDETPASVNFGTSETAAHSAAGIKDASCVSVPTSACFSA